jgi:1-acyl-sn-glycerol-3-phosphate acyltransferase
LAFRLRTFGQDHLPRNGAAILAANHASFLDPILIGMRARRPVRFLVAAEFYADRRLHTLLRALGAIPVGGDSGMVRSFRHIVEVIRRGGLVGIFPEGGITRDGAMKPFRAGAAVLALQMGVPVVPIHMGGTFDALPRNAKWPRFVPVTLRIGEPIRVAARRNPTAQDITALTESIRNAVGALGASGV